LHSLQRKMFPLRLSILDEVYQPRHENRRLRKSTLTEFEAVWAAELALAKGWPGVETILRDGRCHEVVMWWAHHLGPDEQKELLTSGAVLPLLPVVEHFRDASDHDTLAEARELSEVDSHVIQTVRSAYEIEVGCGACHIGNITRPVANGTTCPADRRDPCMGEFRLHCNATQLGRQCCNGSVCKEMYLPASDVAVSSYSTRCVASTAADDESTLRSINANISPEAVSDRPLPPIFSSSFRTNGTYFNLTADYPTEPAGTVTMLFNQYGLGGMATIRVDFAPVCPFFQLHRHGLDANYGPCSVLFRNDTVSYAYHEAGVRCTYCKEDGTDPWNKDVLCPGNVLTRNVTINFNNTKNMTADLWEYEWFQDNYLILRQSRNWYFAPGSNIPLRVAEDLDTGHTDWYSFEEVASPGISDGEMMDGITGKEYYVNGRHGRKTGCPGPDQSKALKPGELPECTTVAGVNLRSSWPLTTPYEKD
jgi:hypothetical protein